MNLKPVRTSDRLWRELAVAKTATIRLAAAQATWRYLCLLICLLAVHAAAASAQAPAVASQAFDNEAQQVEAILAREHHSVVAFLPLTDDARRQVQAGQPLLEDLNPAANAQPAGALLHHWRGTIFVPGGTAEEVDHLLRAFAQYPKTFAPNVLSTLR